MKRDDSLSVGKLLDGLLRGRGMARDHRKLSQVRKSWVHVAGDDLSGKSRVSSYREGILWVEVGSAALCHRLASFERERLLEALQEHLENIPVTDIRFRIGALSDGENET